MAFNMFQSWDLRKKKTQHAFIGACAKLRKSDYKLRHVYLSVRLSIRLSVRPHATTRLPLGGLILNLKFVRIFRKSVEKI
jgi:hypothetical protein